MAFKFSDRSLKRMDSINPKLKELMIEAISISPIDFGIPEHGGKRTEDEQHELYAAGLSKCDGVVKKSYHQSGNAVDVYAFVNGKASWDKKHLAMIAGAVLSLAKSKGLKIRWGGTFGSKAFNGWDFPHFELRQ